MKPDYSITDWSSLMIHTDRTPMVPAGARPLADWTRLLADGDDEAWRWFHAGYYVTLLRYAAQRSGDASSAS